MTQTVLDRSRINQLRSKQGKKRGQHPQLVIGFLASGLPYLIVNEHPGYSSYTAEDLKTKVQGIKQAFGVLKTKNLEAGITNTPELEVIWDEDDEKLYLINPEAVALMDDDLDQ